MKKGKVLLGFSGGIDSSHAVGLLRESGYLVTALYLDTAGDSRALHKAADKARALGVDFRSADVREVFRGQVIDYFTGEYLSGRTPSPCSRCNRTVKWKTLYDTAAAEGYDYIATGHYFNIRQVDGRFFVARGLDPLKDQSYYLWELPQEILCRVLTPMGKLFKKEIISQLPVSESRKESMGVCFLNGKPYTDFIRAVYGKDIKRGKIIDGDGNQTGEHEGYPYYTIGQKKGLGLGEGECIVAIDPESNTLRIGSREELYHRNLTVSGLRSPDPETLLSSTNITVKIRGVGLNPEGYCRIDTDGDFWRIRLDNPAWACAKGQPVVLYKDDLVVGGGYLENYF